MNQERYKYQRYAPDNGSARWADSEEIKKAATIKRINLTDKDCPGCGLPIISNGKTAYVDNSDTHSLVIGNTGSKKTRLFAMPLVNMFTLANESFIVSDPKGEIYQKTSGLVAAKDYNTVVLDFRNFPQSAYYNPLSLPHELYHSGKEDEAISLINDFLGVLAEPQRKHLKDPFFVELGYSMALAFLLFFINTTSPEECNITNFASFFMSHSSPESTSEIARCMAEGSIAQINIKGVLANKEARNTFGNVSACAVVMLNPFIAQRALCRVLSKNSFDVRKIGKEKTAIYVVVPDEKTTLHFVLSIFIKQMYEILISEAQQQENKKLPVRLNFLLDEFCNIPTIPDAPAMLSASRSRNFRFFLMIQGMYQLRQKYGDNAYTIKENCDNWVFLSSKEYDLLKEISELCGETTYKDMDGGIKTRPLISIPELQRLKKENGEALILHGRQYPYVSMLPDIDDYSFAAMPPAAISKKRKLPSIIPYDADKVISDIKAKKRPLPFSEEVFGTETYYERDNSYYSELLDW